MRTNEDGVNGDGAKAGPKAAGERQKAAQSLIGQSSGGDGGRWPNSFKITNEFCSETMFRSA